MNTSRTDPGRAAWLAVAAAAGIVMITMGARQTTGLFVSPINTATGLGIVSISFAVAVGQFVWGASQPLFGAIADKFGATRVVVAGGLVLALGTALTAFVDTQWGLLLTLGVLSAAGSGAGSISILLGVIARILPPERRSFAAGLINAGGSFGQFLFAPLLQAIIGAAGWVAAMLTMAVVALLTIPLSRLLREAHEDEAHVGSAALATAAGASPVTGAAPIGLGRQIRIALRDRSYLFLHAGFFTCGFHIAFLVTHLPGEVALCGLPAGVSAMALALIGLFNIAGSIGAGILSSRVRMKYLLAWIYGGRAAIIALYLVAPKTATTFYWFAAALGFTWLATMPPTAGLVGKLFGARYLGTLFGLTLLSHQVGGFLGAWLGGLALERYGNFNWMWCADIALALAAVAANLPIREAQPAPRPAAMVQRGKLLEANVPRTCE